MAKKKKGGSFKFDKRILALIIPVALGGLYQFNPQIAKEVDKILVDFGLISKPVAKNDGRQNSAAIKNSDEAEESNQKVERPSAPPKGHQTKFCQKQNLFDGFQPEINRGFQGNLLNLCYSGFNVLYKHDYRIALWVAEKLTPAREHEAKKGGREPSFYPDPYVQRAFSEAQTIKTEHYTGSGFDRGHLAASRNLPLNDRYESYYMSNIVPQTPENNRNIWANIEAETRCFVQKYNAEVFVVNIPALNVTSGTLKTMKTPAGNVAIPSYMIKAVYVPSKGYVGAYLTNNDKSKTHYERISLTDVKKLSLIDPFPSLSKEVKLRINLPACNKGKNALS